MPYSNIVFAKLEKRILNDPRWFMLSESAQLNYIRLILAACETYNRIPKDAHTLIKMFRTEQTKEQLESTIQEIISAFPKFKVNGEFYFFEDFQEKTNYISKEIQRNSKGIPKEGADKEEDKEQEQEKKKTWDISLFESLWKEYPKAVGRKEAFRHFRASVITDKDKEDIKKALENYKKSAAVAKGYIQNGSTWFNNWRDYINYQEPKTEKEIENDRTSKIFRDKH